MSWSKGLNGAHPVLADMFKLQQAPTIVKKHGWSETYWE